MTWIKRGIIYKPPYDGSWRDNSALTPTPIQINSSTIRVYCSFRDPNGIGRIGYVDVNASNPSQVQRISPNPVLNIGEAGSFDDNGMILGDIVRIGDQYYMYYVGFQLVEKVKFLAFTGLAISTSISNEFQRYSNTPILDRDNSGRFIQAIHSILPVDNCFNIFYAVGDRWENINDKNYPTYNIWSASSDDGLSFYNQRMIIECDKSNLEYRIGRPRVYKKEESYIMNFTYGTLDGKYMAGQACSADLLHWNRNDSLFDLTTSETGWDSVHLSYPAVITTYEGKQFMFYNGNNMGYEGFGFAEKVP